MTSDCYLPIKDYGVIGDTRSAALVARNGSIDWCCWPDFDSPAMFCRLLDHYRGGYFAIHPTTDFAATQSYVDGTNVLTTSFETGNGKMKLTDFMPVQPLNERTDKSNTRLLLRSIVGLGGDVEVQVSFRPTFDYAKSETSLEVFSGGGLARAGDKALVLRCPAQFKKQIDGSLQTKFHISHGERIWLELLYEENSNATIPEAPRNVPEEILDQTIAYWREWSNRCSYRGPYEPLVQRSALALKLLTFGPTGALIAAPTTSLPEAAGGVRNWDYRYTWLRDSALIVYSLQLIGYDREAADFLEWLNRLNIADRGHVQIMYSVRGEEELAESRLEHLEGYCRSKPVRLGNSAYRQTQHDIYGEVLEAAFLYHRRLDKPLPQKWWDEVCFLADQAARYWRNEDHGIWEFRSKKRHFLHSKLLCWVALDRAIKLGIDCNDKRRLTRWTNTRADIRRCILERGYNEKIGAFTQSLDGVELDATALIIPVVGFLPPSDPRIRSTVERIQERLAANGLVYRYSTDDGLPGSEASFAICSFWLVDNLALAGRVDEAHHLFERLVSYASDLGLFSEEIDPQSGTLWGNYPQGFTHLALIRSAFHLAKAQVLGEESAAHDPADRTREMEYTGYLPKAHDASK